MSEAYSILSNEKRRKYFDKHGTMEGEEDNIDFDDVFKEMFSGPGSFTMNFEDMFDDFTDLLKGSKKEQKEFNKMMRELGKPQKKKGRAGRGKKGTKGAGMEDMMMQMMMGDLMGSGPKQKKGKGKKDPMADMFGFGNIAGPMGMDMEDMMMQMMMGEDDDDDLFAGDDYDSDEVEMIAKQMGLNKKDTAMLKKDLKNKYELSKKSKNVQKKKKAEATKKVEEDKDWGTDSDSDSLQGAKQSKKNEAPVVEVATQEDGKGADDEWEDCSD